MVLCLNCVDYFAVTNGHFCNVWQHLRKRLRQRQFMSARCQCCHSLILYQHKNGLLQWCSKLLLDFWFDDCWSRFSHLWDDRASKLSNTTAKLLHPANLEQFFSSRTSVLPKLKAVKWMSKPRHLYYICENSVNYLCVRSFIYLFWKIGPCCKIN